MTNTDLQHPSPRNLGNPSNPSTPLPALDARCPVPPPRGEQGFRDEPVTRRPLPEETVGARPVLHELAGSPLPSSVKGAGDLVSALEEAAAYREELHRTLDWLDFVKAADAYAWNRVLEVLASSSEQIEAAFVLDAALGERHPELRRLLERRTKLAQRSRARRATVARRAARKKEVVTPK